MNHRRTKGYLDCAPLVVALMITAVPVSAQSANEKPKLLEEVIVTAEHRQASLQDTQISLTAFSEAKIKELGISNASDIGQYTPNVTVSQQLGGRNGFAVNIRGVRSGETLVSFDPAVGVYMDGVLIAKNAGALLDVADPERIEVLRGPQGTLYGRNTIGGAINVVTRKPADEFEGSLSATIGNYGQEDIKGMLNIPLLSPGSAVGALKLRVSAASLNRDGFYDNDFDGALQDEIQNKNRDVGLAHLQWEPTDWASARYSYDRTEIDESSMPAFVTFVDPDHPTGSDLEPFRAERGKRPSSISLDGPMLGESTSEGHALNLTFDLNDQMSLHSISSLRETEIAGAGDADGAPILRIHTSDNSELDVLTQELRLVGSAFDAKLDFVVGAYYYDEEGEQRNRINVFAQLQPGVNIILDRSDDAEFAVQAEALYAQGTFTLTPRWDVTAGVRKTVEERSMSKVRTDILIAALTGTPLMTTVTEYPEVEKDFDNVSAVVSTSYRWTDDIMTYAKVSQGYQSGGFNSRDGAVQNFVEGFEEEFLTAYELGWKTTLGDQRFRFNGALFLSDYDDKQVNQFDEETTASIIRNAGVVEIRGLELEFHALVTDHIDFGLDYGYTDPEYVEYDDGQGNDLTNSNFPYTPKHNAHAFVRYENLLSFGLFSARLDWSYRDEITFLVPAPEINSGDSRQLWNARVSLSDISGPGDSIMRVSLWGKNITDEEYWNFGVDIFNALGFALNSYGAPRTYGLDFTVEF